MVTPKRPWRRVAACLATSVFLMGSGFTDRPPGPPLKLKFTSPKADQARSTLFTTQWPLTLRMEIPRSVAFISTTEGGKGRRTAWVYSDPDGCLDVSDFRISGPIPYEEGCAGPDEKWVEATNERDDINFAVNNSGTRSDQNGNFVIRELMKDDPFNSATKLLNVQYYIDDNNKAKLVPRPRTGGDIEDGLGWGADDDWPGLVLMSDTGAAKVLDFDLQKPNGTQYIRNMAGLMQEVSSELLDRSHRSSVTGHAQVLAGMFEPVAVFDLSIDPAGPYGGFDFVRSVDGGPVEGFNTDVMLGNNTETTVALLETISPVDIVVRAVVVEGTAPDFIADMDGNGKYTQRDLQMMGFTPISNQTTLKTRLEFEALLSFPVGTINCPHRNLIFLDLDGDGSNGDPNCGGTSSVRRGTRVPR